MTDSCTDNTDQEVGSPLVIVRMAKPSSAFTVGLDGDSLASKVYRLNDPSVLDSAKLAAQTYNVPANTTVIATIKIVAMTGLTASSSLPL